ncbi:transcription repressor OFP13-like [Lolium rigidum]|uniref:transcription repressor OFP13-like n=1 Tax=Lolium rigidum TaxID=89674 RepID=UPI001F5C2ECC|nr:transcription repressor OFP13-like [Lolium rigidum]
MSTASSSTTTSWQWPSCAQARTMSFGRTDDGYDGEVSSTRKDCKTRVITNPAYCNDERSFFSTIDSSASTSAPVSEADELIIRGIRSSSRLFFEPEATSSIVNNSSSAHAVAFGGARAMAIHSTDPYGDFRRSMEEMVLSQGANGVDDWGWLEEMLGWYLRANGKKTHGLIVGAFVDLLVALTSSSSIKQSDQC